MFAWVVWQTTVWPALHLMSPNKCGIWWSKTVWSGVGKIKEMYSCICLFRSTYLFPMATNFAFLASSSLEIPVLSFSRPHVNSRSWAPWSTRNKVNILTNASAVTTNKTSNICTTHTYINSSAGKVTAGLAKINGSLPPGWAHLWQKPREAWYVFD